MVRAFILNYFVTPLRLLNYGINYHALYNRAIQKDYQDVNHKLALCTFYCERFSRYLIPEEMCAKCDLPVYQNFPINKQRVLDHLFTFLTLPKFRRLSEGVGKGDEGNLRGSGTDVYSVVTKLTISEALIVKC